MKTTEQLRNELVDIEYRIKFLKNESIPRWRENHGKPDFFGHIIDGAKGITRDVKEIARLHVRRETFTSNSGQRKEKTG